MKIQCFNRREPKSVASRNDPMPISSPTVLGCRLLTNASLSLFLIRLKSDIEVQPSPNTSNTPESHPELKELSSRKWLKIIHQNIRGLTVSKDSLCQIVDGFKYLDIISLCETHLSDREEPQAQLDEYTFVSKPCRSGKGKGERAYISSAVPFHRRLDLEEDETECIWIGI